MNTEQKNLECYLDPQKFNVDKCANCENCLECTQNFLGELKDYMSQ